MRTFIFLCLLSVVALTLASPIPEDEEEISKRFIFKEIGDIIKDGAETVGELVKNGFKEIKNGVKKITKKFEEGGEHFGKLLTKEGKDFGDFFINNGHAILKVAGQVYQLNDEVFKQAKRKFEKEVKNVKFGDFLVFIFPALDTSVENCKEKVKLLLEAEGAGPLASIGAGPINSACRIRTHVIKSLKDELSKIKI